MADKQQKYLKGARLTLPNGEVRVYTDSAEDIDAQQFVEPNANGRLSKFRGGMRLPTGLTVEPVKKDEWTFVLVQNGQPIQPEQSKIQLSPEQIKKIEESKSK